MIHKTVFAGFGGQGVLRMGYLWALAAMDQGRQVTYLPGQGPAVRGGAADCTVAVSDREIASPVASSPDAAVVMHNPGLARLGNLVRPGGVVLVDRSLVGGGLRRDDVELLAVAAGELARQAGGEGAAHLVMLGALAGFCGLVPLSALQEALAVGGPGHDDDSLQTNRRALELGARAARR